jgi:cell division protein FtsW
MSHPTHKAASWVRCDHFIILILLSLLGLGLLMVASASSIMAEKQFDHTFYYLYRQLIFVGISLFLSVGIYAIPMAAWQRLSPALLLVSFLLLVMVLVPGIGHVVNGSRRWIALGFFSIQVSELVKLLFIIYLSGYIARHHGGLKQPGFQFMVPLSLLGVISVLLLLEPDFGSVAVLSATVLMMLFLAGVRWLPFSGLFLLVMLALGALAVLSPYRLERLTTFMNPWAHAFDSGYQLTQSLIAVGRGGLFGVGLGNSVQKLFYLPEAHTDFIFAVLAEELGLLGQLCLILLFAILVYRILRVAWRAIALDATFSGFVCFGAAFWLSLQVLINISVNIGLLPTKGLTLPLISYGGSSLLINVVLIAIVLRVSRENEAA